MTGGAGGGGGGGAGGRVPGLPLGGRVLGAGGGGGVGGVGLLGDTVPLPETEIIFLARFDLSSWLPAVLRSPACFLSFALPAFPEYVFLT